MRVQRRPLDAYQTIRLRPLTPSLGAEVDGVILREPLPAETLAEIRTALNEWKVLFFRVQHLDHAQHVRFARQFGRPGDMAFWDNRSTAHLAPSDIFRDRLGPPAVSRHPGG